MPIVDELYGGCSVTGLGEFNGTAAQIHAELKAKIDPAWRHGQYVAIITDNQPGGLKGAKQAGFIEVGSWKTIHGDYRCRLFVHGKTWMTAGADAKELIKADKPMGRLKKAATKLKTAIRRKKRA